MPYHTITAPVDDAIAFEKAAIDKTLVLPDVEGTLIAPQFSHIFSGGYAAGYYGYKWAEVLDADAFSVFKANGIFDPVTATSFRDNILKRGGTENPMILYKRFKGSEPTIDALMRRDGIINKQVVYKKRSSVQSSFFHQISIPLFFLFIITYPIHDHFDRQIERIHRTYPTTVQLHIDQ